MESLQVFPIRLIPIPLDPSLEPFHTDKRADGEVGTVEGRRGVYVKLGRYDVTSIVCLS